MFQSVASPRQRQGGVQAKMGKVRVGAAAVGGLVTRVARMGTD